MRPLGRCRGNFFSSATVFSRGRRKMQTHAISLITFDHWRARARARESSADLSFARDRAIAKGSYITHESHASADLRIPISLRSRSKLAASIPSRSSLQTVAASPAYGRRRAICQFYCRRTNRRCNYHADGVTALLITPKRKQKAGETPLTLLIGSLYVLIYNREQGQCIKRRM